MPDTASLARFRRTLDALAPDGRLAVAVSGGPDSLALMLLCAAARPATTIAATVDHGLRPDAAAEAAMVARVCHARGVPHATLGVTVADDLAGPQAAARTARYAALETWARGERAAWLLTAHHADDQAETMLMRLARGAGLGGLAGIRARRELGDGLALVRPLLAWRKAELVAIVAGEGPYPADDPSNRDPRHDRSRFRAFLADAPLLDPARLAASARHLAEAEAALEWIADRLWHERARAVQDGLSIDVGDVPRELRRRLLARALPEARGDDVARLLDRLDAGGQGTLAGRLARADGAFWRVGPEPPRRRPPI